MVWKSEPLVCLSGLYLAVGFASGAVQVLEPCTLQQEGDESFQNTQDCITHLTFSHDSSYLATAVSVLIIFTCFLHFISVFLNEIHKT